MTDFYLRFNDEQEANMVLYTVTVGEDDETIVRKNYENIDVIGVMYENPPEDPPEGYEPKRLPGWHVNVRTIEGEDDATLKPFEVTPAPARWRRVWY